MEKMATQDLQTQENACEENINEKIKIKNE